MVTHGRGRISLVPFLFVLALLFLLSGASRGRLSGEEGGGRDHNSTTPFPPLEEALRLASLSGTIYAFIDSQSCDDIDQSLLPDDTQCELYEHSHETGTQVLVVTSPSKNYVAVAYAGTDDTRTTLSDGDILTKTFGPLDENDEPKLVPNSNIKVHRGFDNAVFHNGVFDRVLSAVSAARENHPTYRILTTGHSLGAADSVLTSVALHHHYPDELICNINFGCPRTGNGHWRSYVNDLLGPKLEIWRFVKGFDVVPRLPLLPFRHVGHTVQMDRNDCKAYYLHSGDDDLGYKGVPLGWSSGPFILIPVSVGAHFVKKYEEYLAEQSAVDKKTFYFDDFERIGDDSKDDIPEPPDDGYPDYLENLVENSFRLQEAQVREEVDDRWEGSEVWVLQNERVVTRGSAAVTPYRFSFKNDVEGTEVNVGLREAVLEVTE